MKRIIVRIIDKVIYHINNRLFVKQWILGFASGDIKEIIRNRNFNCSIAWQPVREANCQFADPFFLDCDSGNLNMFIEDVRSEEHYGKIALLTVNKDFKPVDHKIILDTQSHLSYPYIFRENGKTYVFPEASKSGKLSCYEYDSVNKVLIFKQDIIELPLLDSNVIKYNNKYWVSGAMREKNNPENYELRCFFSDNLFGPYTPHPGNALKKGLDGVRGAGNFIEVDGVLYRPTQNCREEYGKSMAVNKINILSETEFSEEFYMSISINKKDRQNAGMHTIHTINVMEDVIVVDGIKWTFSPISQHREIMLEKAYFRRTENRQ